MDSIKVSVIVPVYNAESTIYKCLDSLVNQSLSDWELILVDDGSTDRSGKICDEYAKRYSMVSNNKFVIRMIHQANGGVSSARQAGLDIARGEYIIHTDPDDWVETNMLEELYGFAKKENADMVICDFVSEVNGEIHYKSQTPTSLDHNSVLNDIFGKIHGSCCNKLVKRECVLQHSAHFPVGINYCEDVCFNVQLLKYDIKIAYIPQAYYHYVQSCNSITNHHSLRTFESQKCFVKFLTTQLPIDSAPVIKSKLLVKKLAYRHKLLADKELLKLYPDIKKTDDKNPILRWMYDSAFKGRFNLANALLNTYKFYKR